MGGTIVATKTEDFVTWGRNENFNSKGKLRFGDGNLKKISSHGDGSMGKMAISGLLITMLVMAILSAIPNLAVGLPLWLIGAEQGAIGMIIAGKVFTFLSIGSFLFGACTGASSFAAVRSLIINGFPRS